MKLDKRKVFTVVLGLAGFYVLAWCMSLLDGRPDAEWLRLIVLVVNFLYVVACLTWLNELYKNPERRKRGEKAIRLLVGLMAVLLTIALLFNLRLLVLRGLSAR